MTTIERETEALDRMKRESEIAQLRFENKWLREANKGLAEALRKLKESLPPESII